MQRSTPSTCNVFANSSYVKFDLDPIDDPQYGKAKLSGEIPLQLPFRGTTLQELIPGFEHCGSIAAQLIDVGRAVWPHDEDDRVLKKLHEFVVMSTFTSGISVENPRLVVWTYFTVLMFGIDDKFDLTDDFGAFASGYKEFVEEYRSTEFILRKFASADAELDRMLGCWEGLRAQLFSIPNFMDKYEAGFKKEFGRYIATSVLAKELKWAGLTFSDATMTDLLRSIGGGMAALELVLLCRDVQLPDHIRSDVLFGVIRNIGADISSMLNAIFGLPRDLKLGQVDSNILCPVAEGRMQLQSACDKAQTDLIKALHDFKIATDKLLEVYPDDGNVALFVDVIRNAADGTLYAYKFMKRYGMEDKITIVQHGPKSN